MPGRVWTALLACLGHYCCSFKKNYSCISSRVVEPKSVVGLREKCRFFPKISTVISYCCTAVRHGIFFLYYMRYCYLRLVATSSRLAQALTRQHRSARRRRGRAFWRQGPRLLLAPAHAPAPANAEHKWTAICQGRDSSNSPRAHLPQNYA